MIRVALTQLLERDVRLEVAEVLAIAQSLATAPGVPVLGNVEIGTDGSAVCMAHRGEPTVPALATLIDQLLPPAGVPAALRYAVARGMGAVTAPPFPSVAAFSAALTRFEAGDRAEIIRRLLARARPTPVAVPTAMAPLATSSVPEAAPDGEGLLLRTAEAAEYEDLTVASAAPRKRHSRALAAAAALVVSGLAGFAGAELWRSRSVSHTETAAAVPQTRRPAATTATARRAAPGPLPNVKRDAGSALGTTGRVAGNSAGAIRPDTSAG